MAKRTWESDCLVLSLKTFGEGHRTATLLLPEDETGCKIEHATLYGGPKSKLRGLVVPYQSGRVWLYSNPIKNSTKISDFKVSEYRSGIRENITRIWCASLAAELAIKLEGNIDWDIINYFLTGISRSDENQCRLALIRFLWRLIIFSGLAPDIKACSYCEEEIEALETELPKCGKDYFYQAIENTLLCSTCIQKSNSAFKLSEEALLYLYAIQYLSPKVSRDMAISEQAYAELKQFLFYQIQTIVNSPLKTLQSVIEPVNNFV